MVEKLCFCMLVVVLMIELRYLRYDLFVYNLYMLYLQNWVVQRVNVYVNSSLREMFEQGIC